LKTSSSIGLAALDKKELRRVVTFLNELGGRDKFTKWMQFASKFIAYLLVTGQRKELSQRLNDLAADLSQCRKGFRLFRSLQEVDKISATLEGKEDQLMKLFTVLMAVFYAVFWYYDAKVYFAKAKFLKNATPATLNISAGRWWFCGLVCQLVVSILKIKKIQETKSKEEKKGEDTSKMQASLFNEHLSIVALMGDFVCCINQAQYDKILGRQFNDGFVSGAGLFSASIGIYQAFPK